MQFILSISQIVIAISLIVTILLQQRGAGGSGVFGGGGGGGYYAKRGFEKVLFTATIILSCLFIATAFTSLLI
ncbi:MAG: preprotein translocase subunit SecG [Patescibacteria group bacterium]|nr:preprotein translocase subunit SecG [Patescibacteria group bacterium]